MLRPAACLVYACDQNEPSKIETKIVWVPEDRVECEAFLFSLMGQFLDVVQLADLTFGIGSDNDQSCYCDLYVSDGGVYLLLTYLDPKTFKQPE